MEDACRDADFGQGDFASASAGVGVEGEACACGAALVDEAPAGVSLSSMGRERIVEQGESSEGVGSSFASDVRGVLGLVALDDLVLDRFERGSSSSDPSSSSGVWIDSLWTICWALRFLRFIVDGDGPLDGFKTWNQGWSVGRQLAP